MASRADMRINVSVNDRATKQLKTIESNIIRVVGSISAAFAAGALLLFPIREAAEFERQMKDVQKTTGFTDASIESLGDSLIDLSRTLGISAKELGGIAAIAGQLGLGDFGRAAIEKFTESVAIASVTLGLSTEELAAFGAQATSIFNIGPGEVSRIFDSINELSNNTVATTKDIIDIVKRIGPVASDQITEVLALAAATKQLGVSNEVGATFYVKLFPRFLTKAQKFADVMGVTKEHWEDIVATEGNMKALELVTRKISRLPKSEQIGQLIDLGGEGSRSLSVFVKATNDAVNSQTQLERAIGISVSAYSENISSAKEYAVIMSSVTAQTTVLKNAFTALAINAGEKTLGTLQLYITRLNTALSDPAIQDYFERFGEGLNRIVIAIAEGIDYISEFTLAWKALSILLGTAIFVNVLFWLKSLVFLLGKVTFGPIVAGLLVVGAALKATWVIAFSYTTKAASAVWLYKSALDAATAAALRHRAALGLTAATIGKISKTLKFVGRFKVLLGGVVGFLAVIGSILYDNWEAVKGLFGFMDDKARVLERRARVAEREQEDSINKSKEAVKELNDLINSNKTPVIEDPFGAFTGSKEQATIFKEMGDFINTVGVAFGGLAAQENEVSKATADIEVKQAELNERMRKYLAYRDKLEGGVISGHDRIQLGLVDREIAKVQASLDLLSKRKDVLAPALGIIDENAARLVDEIISKLGTSLPRILDEKAIPYLKYAQDAQIAQEEVDKLTKSIKRNTSVVAGAATNEKALIETKIIEDDVDALAIANDKLDKASGKLVKVGAGLDAAQKTFLDVNITAGRSAKEIGDVIPLLQAVTNELTIQGVAFTNLTDTEKSLAEGHVANKIAILAQISAVNDLAKSTVAYAETAKSAFNNIENEVIALNNSVLDFSIDLDQALQDRQINIDAQNARTQLKSALDDEKAQLKAFAKEAIKIRGAGSRDAINADLAERIKELDAQSANNVSALRRTEIEKSLVEQKSKVLDLIEQTKQATEAHDVDEAMALRKDAKEEYNSLQDLLSELTNLQSVDSSGIVSALVPEGDVQKAKADFESLGETLQVELRGTGAAIRDEAVRQAEEFTGKLSTLRTELKLVNEMLKTLTGTYKNLNQAVRDVSSAVSERGIGVIDPKTLVSVKALAVGRENITDEIREQGLVQDTLIEKEDKHAAKRTRYFKQEENRTKLQIERQKALDAMEDAKPVDFDYSVEGEQKGEDYADEHAQGAVKGFKRNKPLYVAALEFISTEGIADTAVPIETEFYNKSTTQDYSEELGRQFAADPVEFAVTQPDLQPVLDKIQKAISARDYDVQLDILGREAVENAKDLAQDVNTVLGTIDRANITPDVAEYTRAVQEAADKGAEILRVSIGNLGDLNPLTDLASEATVAFDNIPFKEALDFNVEVKVEGPNGEDFYTQGRAAGTQYGEAFGQSNASQMEEWQDAYFSEARTDFTGYAEEFKSKFKEIFKVDYDKRDINEFTRSVTKDFDNTRFQMVLEGSVQEDKLAAEVKAAAEGLPPINVPVIIDKRALDTDLETTDINIPAKVVVDEEGVQITLDQAELTATAKIEIEQEGVEALSLPVDATMDTDQVQSAADKVGGVVIEVTAKIADVINGTGFSLGGAVSSFATGGAVHGAGTATSDSIPAWLSNGEFVIDAFTTRFFGGSFFSGLQSLAKTGRRPKMKDGLPAFAGGGQVGSSSGGSGAVGGVTTLNLTLNGKESTLYGAKEAVESFVDAMTELEKGLA